MNKRDEENMVCLYNQVLFHHNKGCNYIIGDKMDEPEGIMLSKINQHKRTNAYHVIHNVQNVYWDWKRAS
jgi:hypothetical protein